MNAISWLQPPWGHGKLSLLEAWDGLNLIEE